MGEKNEADKEIKLVFDTIYQTEVATNALKHNLETHIAEIRTQYRAHYKGTELKASLTFLEALREERLQTITKAETEIQIDIIKNYVKKEMEE